MFKWTKNNISNSILFEFCFAVARVETLSIYLTDTRKVDKMID